MKHLGDITKIDGAKIPIVDVIVGGSPCQDISLAGKREGLKGERSSLFMEQIRIVKEMREYDRGNGTEEEWIKPRYMLWENVDAALNSNSGRDFQTILTEVARIAEPDAPDVPMPKKGRWPKSGYVYDELGRWSVAWKVHNAQWWGVPQRRKRLALLADFNGLTAGDIVFDPQYRRKTKRGEHNETERHTGDRHGSKISSVGESMSGNNKQSGKKGKETARDIENSIGGSDSG